MKATLRGLLLTALVALVAGFGGVWLGMKALAPAPPPSLHDVIHNRLDLTADQLSRIETLESTFSARQRALQLEMRSANADLAAAIREEHQNGPRVAAAVERFHDAMGRLQTETISHMFAMREVLNDEQKAIFDDSVVETLTAETE